MEENKLFPTPNEVLQLPTSLTLAVLDIRGRLSEHNFKFKPDYQVQRHFQELKSLLFDSGWSLSKDVDNNWSIEPRRS